MSSSSGGGGGGGREAIAVLAEFLGDKPGNGIHWGETWTVEPFRDAWFIAPPPDGRRGGSRYLVMGDTVQPVNFAHTTLDEACDELRDRVGA